MKIKTSTIAIGLIVAALIYFIFFAKPKKIKEEKEQKKASLSEQFPLIRTNVPSKYVEILQTSLNHFFGKSDDITGVLTDINIKDLINIKENYADDSLLQAIESQKMPSPFGTHLLNGYSRYYANIEQPLYANLINFLQNNKASTT